MGYWSGARPPSLQPARHAPTLGGMRDLPPPGRRLLCFALGALAGATAARRLRQAPTSDARWFEMSNDMLVEASLGPDGRFVRLTESWERSLGWTREELMARPFRELVHPDDYEETLRRSQALSDRPGEIVDFENRYRAKDGSYRWLLWRVRSDADRKYAVARDITERKELEAEREQLLARVEALARTDDLTRLPNRRAWDEEVPRAIALARRHGHPLALALLDLDHFKRFNDTRGHQAGDALLTDAAGSWTATLRTTDYLARYGGEEFALLLPDCPIEEVNGLLERLRAATPGGQTLSVGVTFWDRDETAGDLVARADTALYEAKATGRDRVVVAAC